MASKKILVSGFEPFAGDECNPSAELLHYLENKNFPFELDCILLPVSFQNAYPLLHETILKTNPDSVLMTGFAKNRSSLTAERIGINWIDARIPDNHGEMPRCKKILENAEDGLFSTLPLDQLIRFASEVGGELKISTTAGEFVCNQLLYLYLFHWRKIPGGFIHLPQFDNEPHIYKIIESILFGLSRQ